MDAFADLVAGHGEFHLLHYNAPVRSSCHGSGTALYTLCLCNAAGMIYAFQVPWHVGLRMIAIFL